MKRLTTLASIAGLCTVVGLFMSSGLEDVSAAVVSAGWGAALVVLILIAIATSMAIAALLIRRRRPSAGLRHIVLPESLSPSPRSTL